MHYIQAAYQAYDGEPVRDARDARVLLESLAFLITRAPILHFSAEDKRFYVERYAILGESFEQGHERVTKRNDKATAKALAHFVRSFLKADLLVDPASFSLRAIPCAILPFPRLTCPQGLERLRKIFE